MQIKFTTPPLWDKIVEKFKVTLEQPIFYTYGNTIYSPSGLNPTSDIIAHEFTHGEQQQYSDDVANIWWLNYIHDPEFRIAQESEAYGNQYRFICEKFKDRNIRDKWLRGFSEMLSGKIYDNCIGYQEARKLILEFSTHGRPKLDKNTEDSTIEPLQANLDESSSSLN